MKDAKSMMDEIKKMKKETKLKKKFFKKEAKKALPSQQYSHRVNSLFADQGLACMA